MTRITCKKKPFHGKMPHSLVISAFNALSEGPQTRFRTFLCIFAGSYDIYPTKPHFIKPNPAHLFLDHCHSEEKQCGVISELLQDVD